MGAGRNGAGPRLPGTAPFAVPGVVPGVVFGVVPGVVPGVVFGVVPGVVPGVVARRARRGGWRAKLAQPGTRAAAPARATVGPTAAVEPLMKSLSAQLRCPLASGLRTYTGVSQNNQRLRRGLAGSGWL